MKDSLEKGLVIAKPLETGIQVLDNLMGGGLLPGDIILLADEEGSPSKFLLYEIIDNLIKSKGKCIYVSFDEAPINILRDTMLFGKNFNPYVVNKNLIFIDCFTKGITLRTGKELLEEEVKSPDGPRVQGEEGAASEGQGRRQDKQHPIREEPEDAGGPARQVGAVRWTS